MLKGPADAQKRYGCDRGEDGTQHDKDEPRCAICGLRRRLGDAHGVDESVRNKEEELHVN